MPLSHDTSAEINTDKPQLPPKEALRSEPKRISLYGLATRLAIIAPLFLPAGCERKPSTDSTKQASFEGSTSIGLSLWLANKILEELSDGKIFDNFKKQKVKIDLEALESSLGRRHTSLAQQIHKLRSEIDGKASPEDIRKIIQNILSELEGQLGQLDTKLDRVAIGERAAEETFGYLPTVTPSPLLRSGVDGALKIHPLTTKWVKLVSASETHRIELEELSSIYKPNAPEMLKAMNRLEDLKRESAELHMEIETDLAKQLLQRVELLKTRRSTHPDVKNFDANIASLAWLAVVSRSDKESRYAGTLPVPKDLTGYASSDIIAAFELGGVTKEGIIPLFRKLTDFLPASKVENYNIMPQKLKNIQAKYETLASEMGKEFHLALETEQKLRTLLQTHSGIHPEVLRQGKQKIETLRKISILNKQCDQFLNEALSIYIEQLKVDRPHAESMRQYNWSVVRPLTDIVRHTNCSNWNNTEEVNATWNNFLQLHNDCAMKYGNIDWHQGNPWDYKRVLPLGNYSFTTADQSTYIELTKESLGHEVIFTVTDKRTNLTLQKHSMQSVSISKFGLHNGKLLDNGNYLEAGEFYEWKWQPFYPK